MGRSRELPSAVSAPTRLRRSPSGHRRVSIGVLTPSSNTVVEPTTIRLLAPIAEVIGVHFTRVRVTSIDTDPATARQFGLAPMLEAARLLADAKVDIILWSGTSGTWEGLAADQELAAAISEATGVPSMTATQAMVKALTEFRVRRYGLIVPYIEPIADAIVANLRRLGFDCVGKTFESLTTNWAFASVSAEVLANRARTLASAPADALVVSCTNLRGADIVEDLERELGLPILDSVVVGLHGALRQLGIAPPATGFGRLAGLEQERHV